MKRPKLSRAPVKARTFGAGEAWYYENAKSIDLYMDHPSGVGVIRCRLSRARLADWVARTK